MAPLLHWSRRFVFGACAAVLGASRALSEKQLRVSFSKNALWLLVASLALVAVLWLLVLPFEWLAALMVSAQKIDATLRAARYAAGSVVPYVLVAACRYCSVGMFEDAFFAGLAARDASLAKLIRKKKAVYWDWEYVRHSLLAIARQLGFWVVALLAKPILGALIPLFRFGHRIRRMESVFWIPVFVLFLVPATRDAALQVVHLWMDARAVIRELYDPIIARLKSAHSDAANAQRIAPVAADVADDEINEQVKKNLQSEWHRGRSDAARLGFAVVFGYLLQLPLVGPLAWFVGFVAAGLFAPELIELKWFAVSSADEPPHQHQHQHQHQPKKAL
ncbi:hypothetical protein PybrP1_003015 [[Pythium] brassicae (nom. inval.)]|nr:hypothetical protein PybrP1_003015 [[Pythium] brassicae (nom. inval.)]